MNRGDAAVSPELKPMLGKLVRELPYDGYLYEPKWDGFRCLAFRSGDDVDMRSRHGRPLGRYFPEVVEAIRALPASRLALDGELVLLRGHRFDFSVLMSRLHPAASRVERLRREAPATLIAFDLLALEGDDLLARPFAERRTLLERALDATSEPALELTPITDDPVEAARWLDHRPGTGIDGVMAKRVDLPYRPGARAMLKVKLDRTIDCVVGGFRVFEDGALASLLLGLYDEQQLLQHVGVASSFEERRRHELTRELVGDAVPLRGHPWEQGFLTGGGALGRLPGAAGRWSPEMELDWVPVKARRVCEVAYEHLDHRRFRHPARFRRWRPDRDPASCTFAQLERG